MKTKKVIEQVEKEIVAYLKIRPTCKRGDFLCLGTSYKTFQRAFAELVKKGQLKKTGERRWRRYSLNNLH